MKNQFFAAIIGTALALPLFAHAQDAYVGANVGRSELKLSGDLGSDKEDKTGYKAYAGYDFTKNFGVEAGYADLGKLKDREAGVTGTLKTHTLYLAGTGTLPINEQFSAFAKVGVAHNRTKADISGFGTSFSGSKDKTAAMFGVGASYNFTQKVSAVLEYDDFGKTLSEDGVKLKANLVSVGVRYKF